MIEVENSLKNPPANSNCLKEQLDCFLSLSLDMMDSVNLMDRTDIKYLFPFHRLPVLLQKAQPDFRILEINKQRCHGYSTIYFDTGGFDFYYRHITERPGRQKVRFRTYVNTGIKYLEVKQKTFKGRTVKQRIINNMENLAFNEEANDFLNGFIPEYVNDLRPVLKNDFHRITLVGLNSDERVTLDYGIIFSSPAGESISFPCLAVAEVKRNTSLRSSEFQRILKSFQIRACSFSKYCTGAMLLLDLPKGNTIKPKLLLLNKIENEYNSFNERRQTVPVRN
jgi:hypothetical protein